MSVVGTTYSFKDLTGAIVSAVAGTLIFGGQLGVGQMSFQNTTDHTAHDTAADGVVMPSFVAGDSGTIVIECQQTSLVHKFLLNWLNVLKTAAMNDDVSNWASTTGTFRNTLDGSVHQAIGISPMKAADKTYAANGGRVTWTLPVCSLTNL
jgi:hypothetical protein